jgi:hypothetical protein
VNAGVRNAVAALFHTHTHTLTRCARSENLVKAARNERGGVSSCGVMERREEGGEEAETRA